MEYDNIVSSSMNAYETGSSVSQSDALPKSRPFAALLENSNTHTHTL